MRIAVDARELQGHATGVGTYLSAILEEWATLPAATQHEVILCAPDATQRDVVGAAGAAPPRHARES